MFIFHFMSNLTCEDLLVNGRIIFSDNSTQTTSANPLFSKCAQIERNPSTSSTSILNDSLVVNNSLSVGNQLTSNFINTNGIAFPSDLDQNGVPFVQNAAFNSDLKRKLEEIDLSSIIPVIIEPLNKKVKVKNLEVQDTTNTNNCSLTINETTGNLVIDPSLNLIVKSRTYQELNSYNGYYGLSKDAYPSLNPSSLTLFKSLTTFTPITTGTSTRFQGICWSPELQLIVACGAFTGSSQHIVTSPNGITWTARNTTAGYTYRSVVWSPQLSLFVAVGGAGNNSDQSGLQRIITSNDGITWTARTSPTDNAWGFICWSAPLNRFVAVSPLFATGGVGADIRAMYSNDGITWISSNIPLDVWSAVGWVDELGLFIATGTNNIATSVDGITWVLRTVPLSSTYLSFSWSKELGLAVVSSVNGIIITSPDGITWTQRTTPVALTGANLLGNVWNSQLGVFLITSASSAFLTYSKDGINWNSNAYYGGGIRICWCPELSIYCYISGGDLAGAGTRGAISALNARIPTALNVFDNSFNNIDQNGNWTLKCKELSSNDSNVSVGSTSGNTEIKCNATGVGGTISLTGGTELLSTTAGGNSGQHLTLKINGTQYKIALLNM